MIEDEIVRLLAYQQQNRLLLSIAATGVFLILIALLVPIYARWRAKEVEKGKENVVYEYPENYR